MYIIKLNWHYLHHFIGFGRSTSLFSVSFLSHLFVCLHFFIIETVVMSTDGF